jgi:hypothetical protein
MQALVRAGEKPPTQEQWVSMEIQCDQQWKAMKIQAATTSGCTPEESR